MAKVEVQEYKSSINDSNFSAEEIALIWEFYVTKAIAKSANQRRTGKDYGWNQLPYAKMIESADITEENIKVLCANSINKTLLRLDLQIANGKNKKAIDIDTCRIACITPYSISDEEPPKPQFGEVESILTHIRNSFAHGMTYFFDNGNILFEDKDKRGSTTAMILLKQQTLLDWISIIDCEHRYYGRTIIEIEQGIEKEA